MKEGNIMKKIGIVICIILIGIIAIINNEYDKKAIQRCQDGGHDFSYCVNIK